MDIKIKKAKGFLRDGKLTITEVCYLCGFKNLSHFTTVLKRDSVFHQRNIEK